MPWPHPPLVSALSPLWLRRQTLPALCPLFVRLVSALSPLWPRLHTLCPPCVCSLSAVVRHVLALCQPCARSSLGLASGLCPRLACCAAVASPSKILSHHCATHSVYIACPLASVLGFILASQIRPLQAHPMLEKLFGVCWYILKVIPPSSQTVQVWLVMEPTPSECKRCTVDILQISEAATKRRWCEDVMEPKTLSMHKFTSSMCEKSGFQHYLRVDSIFWYFVALVP